MPPSRTHDEPYQVDTHYSFPTLAIIAPTPRAFTFPVSHTLDASPYSTPVHSPFEPDLSSFNITSPAPSCYQATPPLSRTLSPNSSVSSVSIPSVSAGSKSATLDAQRRPRKGDDDYIKRPENSFILFRSQCAEGRQQAEEDASRHGCKKQRQADLSKSISQQWKALSAEERRYWEDLAKEKKRIHQEKYPGYVYRPNRVRDQHGKARNKKYTRRRAADTGKKADTGSLTTYVVPPPQVIARSNSAPTPPPPSYQTIHIPNVLPSYPSSSSSSLLPMISRRAGYTGNEDDIMANFDFCPSNLPGPSYGHPDHEAGLQTSVLFDFPAHGPISNGSGATAQLQPPTLNIDPVSASSSVASSPISGPFTPASTISSYYVPSSFDQFVAPPRPDTWDLQQQIPTNFDIQTGVPIAHEMNNSFYPWDPNTIWQTEPSMLLQNDFNLEVIPPIEMKNPQYPDSARFVGLPGENIAGAGYWSEFGDYSGDSEFWNST
ncbi:uncharacterized protein C8R40DRAFT_83357 [Lentinula edodes]|uniref:uncharacterized protein n=1 Tax=Lentinula edodes TaxID=5353 RepID=UPI001E8E5C59|nr:uncharacterized protein C8R40DRAFT_83357 [Lentinula edodes]KAH7876939.1 hypothetical protein C8R40DRAFT_83357 [Lentinula edodes]